MVQNQKLSVSALQNEQHKKMLTELLRQEGNRRCADCHARGPSWASVNLGVFMCLNCSGVHRSLGVHISKVRSTNLDTWLPEQVAFVQAVGNVRGNAFWEATLPSDFRRPPEADMASLRTFINNKYASKMFCPREFKEQPPTIENYATHPFLLQFANGTGAPPPPSSDAPAPPAQQAPSSPSDLPPVIPMPRAVTKAPQPPPEFDLLSLDDSTPAHIPSAEQNSSQPSTVAVPAPAAAAAPWDPFMAAPAPPATATMSAHTAEPIPKKQPQPPALPSRQQDPFDILASMDRAPSSSMMSSSISTSTAPLHEEVSDPFAPIPVAMAPQGPSAPLQGLNATHSMPPKPPGAGGGGGVNGALPSSNTNSKASTGSMLASAPPGPPAMRVNSSSSHTKGSLSHDDILAMFDKPSS